MQSADPINTVGAVLTRRFKRQGDIVRVAECRPLSKTKNWRVVEIVTRAAQ